MTNTSSPDLTNKNAFRIRLDGDPIPDSHAPRQALLGVNYLGIFEGTSLLTDGTLVFLDGKGEIEKPPAVHSINEVGEAADKLMLAGIVRDTVITKLSGQFNPDQLNESVIIDWINTAEEK